MTKFIAIVFATLIILPATASACGPYGASSETLRDVFALRGRIHHAAQKGELTARERARADRQLSRLSTLSDRLTWDGELTTAERRRWTRAVKRTRRLVTHLTTNRFKAPAAKRVASN